jgi:capsular polysaccharide biosynthesis protein
MELRRYILIVRRHARLVAACTLVGLIAALLTLPRVSVYQATTTIYVGNRQFTGTGTLSEDQGVAVERVARTFAVMLASEPIARDALERTAVQASASAVASRTAARVLPGTSLIIVSYSDTDPTRSQAIANALSDALVEQVQNFEPGVGGEGQVPVLPAYVFERADLPLAPQPTGAAGRILTGALFGFVIAAAIAFLVDYLDITVRSAESLERHIGLPVLGVVPELGASALKLSVGRQQPSEAARA